MSPTPDSTLDDPQQIIADLQRANAELQRRLDEALDRQTATAEVLQVINSSPGDLAPVFEAMLEKAMRLCEAAFGLMSTYDGERYHMVATHGVGPQLAEFMRAPPHPDPESALGRIERGEDLVLFDDIADTDVYRKGAPSRCGRSWRRAQLRHGRFAQGSQTAWCIRRVQAGGSPVFR